MLVQLERDFMKLGSRRRLAAKRPNDVPPLDDDALLDVTRPIAPAGGLRHNAKEPRTREEAMVQAALKRGTTAIVLGGAHDLSEPVRRLGGGACEYIRVTTMRYAQIEGRGMP